MRYRITDLLLFIATLAVALGWRSFFLQDLTLEWHERHPVVPVTRMVDGREVINQERVLMYYAQDQFFWPEEFHLVSARFYVPRLLQFISLTVGSIVITRIVSRRWPVLIRRILLCVLTPLGLLVVLICPPLITILVLWAVIKGILKTSRLTAQHHKCEASPPRNVNGVQHNELRTDSQSVCAMRSTKE